MGTAAAPRMHALHIGQRAAAELTSCKQQTLRRWGHSCNKPGCDARVCPRQRPRCVLHVMGQWGSPCTRGDLCYFY